MLERLHASQLNFERVLEELQETMGYDDLPDDEQTLRDLAINAIEALAQPLEIFREVVYQLEQMQEAE